MDFLNLELIIFDMVMLMLLIQVIFLFIGAFYMVYDTLLIGFSMVKRLRMLVLIEKVKKKVTI